MVTFFTRVCSITYGELCRIDVRSFRAFRSELVFLTRRRVINGFHSAPIEPEMHGSSACGTATDLRPSSFVP